METSMNNILLDFNMVIDTDIGLLKFILKNGYDDNSFFNDKCRSLDQRKIEKLLKQRPNINPLSIYFRKDNKDVYSQIDDLYNDFISDYYQEILDMSIKTSMFDLCNVWKDMGEIKTTILCKNLAEEQLIKSKDSNLATIIVKDDKDVDLSNFDSLFIKDCQRLLDFNENTLIQKGIYIADYDFNHDNEVKELPCMDVADCICLYNEVKFIWVYAQD